MSVESTTSFTLLVDRQDQYIDHLDQILFDLDDSIFTKEEKQKFWKKNTLINTIRLILHFIVLPFSSGFNQTLNNWFDEYQDFKFDFRNKKHTQILHNLCLSLNIKITIFYIENDLYEDGNYIELKLVKSKISFGNDSGNHFRIATWKVDNGLWIYALVQEAFNSADTIDYQILKKTGKHWASFVFQSYSRYLETVKSSPERIAGMMKCCCDSNYSSYVNLLEDLSSLSRGVKAKPKFYVSCYVDMRDEILTYFRRLLKEDEKEFNRMKNIVSDLEWMDHF